MKILFVSGFSPVVKDMAKSKQLYIDGLNLPLEGDYPMTEKLGGVKHFGLWSLQGAARACFGTDNWPENIPIPQATIEFEVEDVDNAARELEDKGYKLLHPAKMEPWNQNIARLISPEGLIVGLSYTPALHGTE